MRPIYSEKQIRRSVICFSVSNHSYYDRHQSCVQQSLALALLNVWQRDRWGKGPSTGNGSPDNVPWCLLAIEMTVVSNKLWTLFKKRCGATKRWVTHGEHPGVGGVQCLNILGHRWWVSGGDTYLQVEWCASTNAFVSEQDNFSKCNEGSKVVMWSRVWVLQDPGSPVLNILQPLDVLAWHLDEEPVEFKPF